jgi:NDP-sugar pyrophosphorylase family protein
MTSPRSIQQLNAPQPVEVRADPTGMPAQVRFSAPVLADRGRPSRKRSPKANHLKSIRTDGQWMAILSIEDLWKVNDEWWRGEAQEIERIYFDLTLESSQRITIFHDLVQDKWFRQAD